jgi:hypothetical protein
MLGEGEIVAVLLLRGQDAPSAHFLEIRMFRAVCVAFGNETLFTSLQLTNSEQCMLETHDMTITDQSAVKNAVSNLTVQSR